MSRLHSLAARWRRLADAARHELLRDPNVILFERVAQRSQPWPEGTGER